MFLTRRFWVRVHRYIGLYLVIFLFIAGATGSILAFLRPISAWLKPAQFAIPARAAPMLDPLELRKRALSRDPNNPILMVILHRDPGEAFQAWPEPAVVPDSGEEQAPRCAHLVLDPYTAEEVECSPAGLWPVTRENVMAVVYALHYSLLLGEPGITMFGIAAVLWTLDCFVGLYLTFPSVGHRGRGDTRTPGDCRHWVRRWAVSWRIKFSAGWGRRNYDLHRASGLWAFPMLLVFAWSAVSFNLSEQVYLPVMRLFSPMADVAEELPEREEALPDPRLDWNEALVLGRQLLAKEAERVGFVIEREQALAYDPDSGTFRYSVMSNLDINRVWGSTTIYFDGGDGAFRGLSLPSGQDAGRTFTNWLTALHMAKVFGRPMQFMVAIIGVAVMVLSITGLVLWLRKRRRVPGRRMGTSRSSIQGLCRARSHGR